MAKLHLAQQILDIIYPIGSIYETFESTDPSTLFGGTWAKVHDGHEIRYCGSQLLCDTIILGDNETKVVAEAYNTSLIDALFSYISANDYNLGYMSIQAVFSAMISTSGSNLVDIYWNDYKIIDGASTWSSVEYRQLNKTVKFRPFSVAQKIIWNYSSNGYEVKIVNRGGGEARITGLTVHGYFEANNLTRRTWRRTA